MKKVNNVIVLIYYCILFRCFRNSTRNVDIQGTGFDTNIFIKFMNGTEETPINSLIFVTHDHFV